MKKGQKEWDGLVDALFELDKAHPYMGDTAEPNDPNFLEDVLKFDEANVNRGKTGPGTNAGSFAPKDTSNDAIIQDGDVWVTNPNYRSADTPAPATVARTEDGELTEEVKQGMYAEVMAHGKKTGHELMVAILPDDERFSKT